MRKGILGLVAALGVSAIVAMMAGCSGGGSSGKSIGSKKARFQVQLAGVDLLNECANGAPPGDCYQSGTPSDPDIWVNEGCNGSIGGCQTEDVEFFEFIDPTAANEVLNSQGRAVDAGTFTHVRVYGIINENGDALKCDGDFHPAHPGFPVVIELGEPVTVN